jgi:membrane-bound metal-dependent hydrolase YbcI (DUF457 family)
MPSPLGHALAGAAVALAAERFRPRPAALPRNPAAGPGSAVLIALCAGLATLPDADLLLGAHRTWTHSVGATAFVFIVAAVVTGWVHRNQHPSTGAAVGPHLSAGGLPAVVWVAAACAAAQASHILLDWLGTDRYSPPGIQALWPFSDRYFLSGWDVFARIERRSPLSVPTMVSNAKAGLQEIAIMGPIVGLLWWRAGRSGRSGKYA